MKARIVAFRPKGDSKQPNSETRPDAEPELEELAELVETDAIDDGRLAEHLREKSNAQGQSEEEPKQ